MLLSCNESNDSKSQVSNSSLMQWTDRLVRFGAGNQRSYGSLKV
jgi:hypothetical protein